MLKELYQSVCIHKEHVIQIINRIEMITVIENFGARNISNGMALVIFKADSLDEVLESDTYFLNPSAPMTGLDCICGFMGTAEQYEKVFAEQCAAQIQKRVMTGINGDIYNITREEYDKVYKEEEAGFRPWWEELDKLYLYVAKSWKT